jgi:hypothetical protein
MTKQGETLMECRLECMVRFSCSRDMMLQACSQRGFVNNGWSEAWYGKRHRVQRCPALW